MKTVIGSHNSWSYLRPKKFWMRLLAFSARCQRVDIKRQYELGVRCFDLRIRFVYDKGMQLAHGLIVYDIDEAALHEDLKWLNSKGDCYLRIIHETRTKSQRSVCSLVYFRDFCQVCEETYKSLYLWCGRNLYDWHGQVDYVFSRADPTCHEDYSSVSSPKLIDDWYPLLYAKRNNKRIKEEGTDKEILLIDFVDI